MHDCFASNLSQVVQSKLLSCKQPLPDHVIEVYMAVNTVREDGTVHNTVSKAKIKKGRTWARRGSYIAPLSSGSCHSGLFSGKVGKLNSEAWFA